MNDETNHSPLPGGSPELEDLRMQESEDCAVARMRRDSGIPEGSLSAADEKLLHGFARGLHRAGWVPTK